MWKSRPRHFQLLSKSALTQSKFHELRSLWRWGSTRNRRIDRVPATALASLLYIYMFTEMKTSCPRTAISVDYRHRSRYYCRAHIQSVSSLSARVAGGFPLLYEWKRAPPVCPVLCEQNYMLSLSLRYYKCMLCSVNSEHRPAKTKPCQKRNAAQKCAVCMCLLRIYIWNNKPDVNSFLHVGLLFYDESRRKVEKALQVNFEMYQVYILSIYLSVNFFLSEKQLNVFVYTEKNISVSF